LENLQNLSMNKYKELTQKTKETNKALLLELVDKIPFLRDPSQFLDYLNVSDFYYAPASTVFHDSVCGGLFVHSLRVFRAIVSLNKMLESREKFSPESLFYVAFGHDVCKIDFYYPVERFRKDKDDHWEKYLGYEVRDSFPLGHGEKSVFIMSKYVPLKEEEILAIRWHMGGFDLAVHDKIGSYAYKAACEFSPLTSMLHCADLLATYIFN